MIVSTGWQGDPILVKHRKRMIENFETSNLLDGTDFVTTNYEGVYDDKERRTWLRNASAGVVCELCGLKYGDHPQYPYSYSRRELNSDTELCSGDLAHL